MRRVRLGAEGAIPDWILKQLDLRRNVVAWPLDEFHVYPKGAHGAWRSTPAEGWCPYRNNRKPSPDASVEAMIRPTDYPCQHYGADLSAPQGRKVYAPHDGWMLYAGPADRAPFVGYGPGAILIAHNDTGDSAWERGWKWATGPLIDMFDFPEGQVAARYSLIGHVMPVGMAERNPLELDLPGGDVAPVPLPKDLWPTRSKSGDHWRTLKDGTVVMMTGADAVTQNNMGVLKRWVSAGDHIGYVSDKNHIHWEIRTAPLVGKEGRGDPVATWMQYYGKDVPIGSGIDEPPPPPPEVQRRGNAGALLLLAALALGSKKKRGGRRRGRRR